MMKQTFSGEIDGFGAASNMAILKLFEGEPQIGPPPHTIIAPNQIQEHSFSRNSAVPWLLLLAAQMKGGGSSGLILSRSKLVIDVEM